MGRLRKLDEVLPRYQVGGWVSMGVIWGVPGFDQRFGVPGL